MSDNLDPIKKRALRILGKRSFSERGMVKRLVEKGEDADAAEETVKWLARLGYINDSDYADAIVKHYTAKGYGEARIRDELHRRGIPREIRDEKLAEAAFYENEQQTDYPVEFLHKKLKGSSDKNDMQRAMQALVRRGFSYDEARSAVSRYLLESLNE